MDLKAAGLARNSRTDSDILCRPHDRLTGSNRNVKSRDERRLTPLPLTSPRSAVIFVEKAAAACAAPALKYFCSILHHNLAFTQNLGLTRHLFNLSSEKLKLNTRVTLIHQDILQFQFPNKQRYKIVGSIPYHLSTQIIKKVVFESHASDIYLIVEEGFYKRTLDIHRTLGLLLHTQVSIQQLLKLPAECFHPKPKVNSVLIKLTRHTTDVPDKYWKLYTYFVSKWVNREYRQLFTKNQFHQAMKHAKVNNLSTVTYEQVLSIFNSYLLFNGRK